MRQVTAPLENDPAPGRNGVFPTTPWSVVVHAGSTDAPAAMHALERLCRMYWYPLYAFLRRQGAGAHDAEDLTQGFFAYLFERNAFQSIGREKGKFRSFLLAACTNYLRDERDKAVALKRGGGRLILSLDAAEAEDCYGREPVDPADPRKLFERRWAYTLLKAALARLKAEYESSGRVELFEKLEPYLTREMDSEFYAREAPGLSLSEGAVRVALHRMRRRFGVLLRSEVAYTVTEEKEIDEELRQLLAAIGE